MPLNLIIYKIITIFLLQVNLLIAEEGDIFWSYLIPQSGIRSTITEDFSGRIFVGTREVNNGTYDGKLYCFDLNNSNFDLSNPLPLWTFNGANDFIDSTPAIGMNGLVYFTSFDSKVYSLNPVNGNLVSSYETNDFILSSPCIGPNNEIYVASSDGFVYCLSADLSQLNWLFYINANVDASPCLDESGSLIVADTDGNVYSFNTNSVEEENRLNWQFQVDIIEGDSPRSPRIRSSPAINEEGHLYFGSRNHIFYGLNTNSLDNNGEPTPLFQENDGAISVNGIVLNDEINASPVIDSSGRIYISDATGILYVFDQNGIDMYEIILGDNGMSTPVISDDNTLYISTFSGSNQNGNFSDLWAINIDLLSAPLGTIDPNNPDHPSISNSIRKVIYHEDLNGNGVLDSEESFSDLNNNGTWDSAIPAEPFVDINNNGQREFFETYTDLNNNFIWDAATPAEPFVDSNNNGQHDSSEDIDNDNVLDTGLNGIIDSSLYLSKNGTLFISTLSGWIYAYDTEKLPAKKGWPQFRRNDRHTGFFNYNLNNYNQNPIVLTNPQLNNVDISITDLGSIISRLEKSNNLDNWITINPIDLTLENKSFFRLNFE